MKDLLFALNAVLPIILLVLLGYFLKQIKFLNKEFLNIGNKFCFYVALPVLLFKNLYDSNLEDVPWNLIIFVVIAIVSVFFISLLLVLIFEKDNDKKGVIIQGIMRSNYAFIGIPLATALFDNNSIVAMHTKATVALVSIFCIPLFNILSVVALSIFKKDDENKQDAQKVLKRVVFNICKNPLITGIIIGIAVLLFRLAVPSSSFIIENKVPFIYKTISNISAIASPLALIVLGGQFNFEKAEGETKRIIIVLMLKMVIIPFIVFFVAITLNIFQNYEYAVLISVFSSPIAIVSSVMAKEMRNDYLLAGKLVVWSTIASAITIFITVLVLRSIGCI